MSSKHNKCASEASKLEELCKEAARGDQKGRSNHASGGELVRNNVPLTCKEVLSPSQDPNPPSPEETLEAYRRLGLLLKELYPRVKSKGYAIINGKLTKVPVDSAKTKKDGTMSPLSDNQASI